MNFCMSTPWKQCNHDNMWYGTRGAIYEWHGSNTKRQANAMERQMQMVEYHHFFDFACTSFKSFLSLRKLDIIRGCTFAGVGIFLKTDAAILVD